MNIVIAPLMQKLINDGKLNKNIKNAEISFFSPIMDNQIHKGYEAFVTIDGYKYTFKFGAYDFDNIVSGKSNEYNFDIFDGWHV